MDPQEDTRGRVASILSIAPDSESGLLDLTSFLDKDDFVGRGGFGEVYRTKWLNKVSGEQVQHLPRMAMKLMRAIPLRDEAVKKKREKYLKREMRLLRDLVHPNILPLIGFVLLENDSNQPSLISLFVSNGTVRDYAINCNMIRLCELMLGIAKGLGYLHDQKVVHGDVKSENVLIDSRGIPKVIDFGLSRLMENSTLWQTSTKDGAPGTSRWQAPELLNGSQVVVTCEADIYAFGMTCWEILKGQIPFPEYRRESEVILAVVNRKERPRRPRRRDLPNGLWYLIEASWSEDPKLRSAFKPITLVISELFLPENYVYRRRYWSESELWDNRELLCKEEDREALIALGELAWIRGNQGRCDEAMGLEELLMEAWTKLDGEDARSTQLARGNLASTYANLAHLDKAEKLQLSLVETWNEELGEKHADTLRATAGLACTTILQYRHKEAEKLLLRGIDGMRDTLGEDHPDVLASMNDLVRVYRRQNRREEAEELSVRLLDARKRVLGENHPDTLRAVSNLAWTCAEQGRLKEAEELHLKALDRRKHLLGENHPGTLLAMSDLAWTYAKQVKSKEAEELYLKVLDARKRVLGESHPNTQKTMRALDNVRHQHWFARGKGYKAERREGR